MELVGSVDVLGSRILWCHSHNLMSLVWDE